MFKADVQNVAASTDSQTLLTALESRKGAIIFNDSSAVLYMKFGTGASSTSHTYAIPAGLAYEFAGDEPYDGIVTGAWASATGTGRCTQWA